MRDTADSGGFLRSVGEFFGSVLAGIPPAIGEFFSGVGAGAGVHGFFDWAAMILGLALLLSALGGIRKRRFVGPVLLGVIGVAFMGVAIA